MNALKILFFWILFAVFAAPVVAKTHKYTAEDFFYRTALVRPPNQVRLNNAWELLFVSKNCTGARQELGMALPIARRYGLRYHINLIEAALKTIKEMEEKGQCKN